MYEAITREIVRKDWSKKQFFCTVLERAHIWSEWRNSVEWHQGKGLIRFCIVSTLPDFFVLQAVNRESQQLFHMPYTFERVSAATFLFKSNIFSCRERHYHLRLALESVPLWCAIVNNFFPLYVPKVLKGLILSYLLKK